METKLLIQLIQISGLTQTEIEEKTGVPQPHLSRWVQGKRTPKLSTIKDIAEKLGYKLKFSFHKIPKQ